MLLIGDLRVDFRPALAADTPFITDSWLESFKLSHAAGVLPMDMYRKVYALVLKRIMARAETQVAFNAEIPDQILGYLCHEGAGLVHFLFVKHAFRRNGIARALMATSGLNPRLPTIYTFKTPQAKKLEKSWTGLRFDPLAARK